MSKTYSSLSCDAENVVIDWIKKASDSRDLVLTLYEADGSRHTARAEGLSLPSPSRNEKCLSA